MHFDKIIMNPPYNGNLHLKILQEAMKHGDEIVNLSPIRWLQDPIAEYNEGEKEKIKHIKTLDAIDATTTSNLFGDIDKVVGIYHIFTKFEENFDLASFQNSVLIKMKNYDCCRNHEVFNELNGILVRCDYFGGCKRRKGSNRTNALSIVQGHKEFCHYALSMVYKNGYSVENGKFWTENRMPGAGNKIKEVGTPIPSAIRFDTEEEAKNFEAYTKTKFAYYIVGTARDIEVSAGKFLPFMPTYTHPWTDKDLYEYFGLNEEEIKEIECSIK